MVLMLTYIFSSFCLIFVLFTHTGFAQAEPLNADGYIQSGVPAQVTWERLSHLSTEELKRLSASDPSAYSTGWITLVLIHRQYHANPEKLVKAIEGWKEQFPTHAANELLSVSSRKNVGQLALFVPLKAEKALLGNAVKDGFLSAYKYTDPKQRPEIKIYDTSTYQDMTALYQKAVEEGADFIIGPLFKEEVQQLSTQPDGFFSVPLLALNQATGTSSAALPSRFFQFSLSPDQEAIMLAERLVEQNKHYPLLIVPQNDWGKRFALAFEARLTQLKGELIDVFYTSPSQNLGQGISQKFEITHSQERFRQIAQLVGAKIDVQPRRRQDIDSVVLAIAPQYARQIKPLLDFYYAYDLPVYGSSNIYSGIPNVSKDVDLNGIQFCEMPWFIVPAQTDYVQRGGQVQTLPEQQARLFAMGVDAFNLPSQLKKLSASPTSRYAGMTGSLSLGEHNVILRELVWAQFKNGVPIRIKSTD